MYHLETILTRELAARIVDRAGATLGAPLSVAEQTARVRASSLPGALDTLDRLAVLAIERGDTVEASSAQLIGIGIPLTYDDCVVGALILHAEPDDMRGMVGVVRALAELIIHQEVVIEQLPHDVHLRDRFISDLVHGRVNAAGSAVPPEAAIFGIDLNVPRLVVAVDVRNALGCLLNQPLTTDSFPDIARTLRLERARSSLIACAIASLDARDVDVCGIVDEEWLVFLSEVDTPRIEQARRGLTRRMRRFVDQARRSLGIDLGVGVGGYYAGWQALCRSFTDAQRAAEKGSVLFGLGCVVALEDLGLISFLTDIDAATKTDLADRLLLPLRDDPILRETLAAFFRCDLSPSAAAAALSIHRHTLAYRLDKIERLTGHDPRRFESAAQLYAALLLTDTSRSSTPAHRRAAQPRASQSRISGS